MTRRFVALVLAGVVNVGLATAVVVLVAERGALPCRGSIDGADPDADALLRFFDLPAGECVCTPTRARQCPHACAHCWIAIPEPRRASPGLNPSVRPRDGVDWNAVEGDRGHQRTEGRTDAGWISR